DAEAVAGALDLDAADRGVRQLRLEVVADLPVLDDVVRVLLAVSEPARLPVGRDAEPEPVGIDLLSHQALPSSSRCADASASPPALSTASSAAAPAATSSCVASSVAAVSVSVTAPAFSSS